MYERPIGASHFIPGNSASSFTISGSYSLVLTALGLWEVIWGHE